MTTSAPHERYTCDCGDDYPSQSAMLACSLEHDREDASIRRAARHRRPGKAR